MSEIAPPLAPSQPPGAGRSTAPANRAGDRVDVAGTDSRDDAFAAALNEVTGREVAASDVDAAALRIRRRKLIALKQDQAASPITAAPGGKREAAKSNDAATPGPVAPGPQTVSPATAAERPSGVGTPSSIAQGTAAAGPDPSDASPAAASGAPASTTPTTNAAPASASTAPQPAPGVDASVTGAAAQAAAGQAAPGSDALKALLASSGAAGPATEVAAAAAQPPSTPTNSRERTKAGAPVTDATAKTAGSPNAPATAGPAKASSSDAKPSPASASTTTSRSSAAGGDAPQAGAGTNAAASTPSPTALAAQASSSAGPLTTAPSAAPGVAPPPFTTGTPAGAAQVPAPGTGSAAATPQHAGDVAFQVHSRIIERFDGRAQRFEVRLDPPQLGRVDVRIEIGSDQRVNAILSAHDSAALADLARGADDLRNALSDAGIDLAEDGLAFELASDQPGDDINRRAREDSRDGASGGPWVRVARSGRADDAEAPLPSLPDSGWSAPWRPVRLNLIA